MAIGYLFVWGGLVMHSLVGGNMVGWCRSFMGRNEKKMEDRSFVSILDVVEKRMGLGK